MIGTVLVFSKIWPDVSENLSAFVFVEYVFNTFNIDFIFFFVDVGFLNDALFHHLEFFGLQLCLVLFQNLIHMVAQLSSFQIVNIELNNIPEKALNLSFDEALKNLIIDDFFLVAVNGIHVLNAQMLYLLVGWVNGGDE